MSERLAAHFENRTYYFMLESQKENEVKISMYGTLYTFLKSADRWMNNSQCYGNESKPGWGGHAGPRNRLICKEALKEQIF
ncbi:hypothetical protein MTO98_07385 [Mucilaginibacter sp. SMC90]|uniref:hypothetical protein n=1 Tax=Mucilaginibacter sp. SMC90 TaxID=2929803 RepID=UPI001FB53C7A|nr:hypothetical protein [Mucilaginibacter sp. SMC90]UOE50899.1 hypothetical protein MTO98_07385 [Mucilaginibacter sp. SMC90]